MPDDQPTDRRPTTPPDATGAEPTRHDDGVEDGPLGEAPLAPLDQLAALLLQADQDPSTVVTSVRIPRPLREALRFAVELGYERSVSDALVCAARRRLDHLVQGLALDEHYRLYPETRPTLAALALATAELADDPLKDQPELVAEVAEWLQGRAPGASPEDVLMAAAGVEHERMGG